MDPELVRTVIYYTLFLVAILASLTVHELSHAWTALQFGDTTARDAGRITLNPMAHVDPIGLVCMLVAGFGWAKPTPVNPSRMNHPRADLVVSAAGPISNFVLATLIALGLRSSLLNELFHFLGVLGGAQLLGIFLVHMNIVLGFFNLLPIGPLDGSHVLRNLLPPSAAQGFEAFNHAYGSMLLMGMIFLGRAAHVDILGMLLDVPVNAVTIWLLGSQTGG